MEPNLTENLTEPVAFASTPAPASAPTPTPVLFGICPVCHQPVPLQSYFCPNCGAKMNSTPLSTTVGTQFWIYVFSIILPMICFIFVTKWQGVKYFKSNDSKAHRIGQIAWALLILSTLVTMWLAYVWTQQMIQSSVNSINTDFGSL